MLNPRQQPRSDKTEDKGKRVTLASLHWSLQWLVCFDGFLIGNCVAQYVFHRHLDWTANFVKSFVFSIGYLSMCYAFVYWQNKHPEQTSQAQAGYEIVTPGRAMHRRSMLLIFLNLNG